MTQAQLKEKERIVAAIARTANISFKGAERIAKHLHGINTRLDWWHEQECDSESHRRWWKLGDDGEYHNEHYDEVIMQLDKYMKRNLPGVKYFVNQDPRGAAVRLYLEGYRNAPDNSTGICWRF